MTFGQKLSALRRGRGYSLEQLAEAIHVSRQAVSKWESEAAMPDTDNVLQLSRLFGVSTDYLLREDWEEDRPLSAGASQGKGVEQEEHWPLIMMLLVAAEAIALFWQLMGSLVYQNHLIPLLGMTVHILAIVCFEAIFQRHRREDGAREQRRWFYRVSVWLTALFPCSFVLRFFWALYPWPASSLVVAASPLLLYLPLCLAVTLLLRRPSADKGPACS